MKKIIFILMLSNYMFAFEGAAVKILTKYFSNETILMFSKQYGDTGLKALEKLAPKYGNNALGIVEKYGSKYGDDGLRLLVQYGEGAVANRTSFEIVKRFGDKGFYLVRKFPQKSIKYYEKYGDKFVTVADQVGNNRTIRYLDDAAQYAKDDKVLSFLDKYGEKGNVFLDRHWGKLLTSGFVLLNQDSLIESANNIAKHGLNKGADTVEHSVKIVADTVEHSVKNVLDSQLGLMIGLALILFVFFKYGYNFIFTSVARLRRKNNK